MHFWDSEDMNIFAQPTHSFVNGIKNRSVTIFLSSIPPVSFLKPSVITCLTTW